MSSCSGWKNVDYLYFLVKNKYLTHRDQYKTFGDFLPVILDYIKATAQNQSFDIGPVEKVEFPKNGLVLGGKEESEKLSKAFRYFTKLGSAWSDEASIRASDLIVLFDYPGAKNMPPNVQTLFAELKTSAANYVNVKRNGDKLLVLIKTDSKEKALSVVGQIESLTKEQYRVYP